jgi:DNA-binding MarR family transcriptional regulator
LRAQLKRAGSIPPTIARATHIKEWLRLPEAQRGAWSGFLRAHAAIVGELDEQLRAEHGRSLREYDVLVRLSRAPDNTMQMHELAESARFSRSGLTRMVDRLAADGLLERRRGASDPRQVFATITEEGLGWLARATPTHLAGVRGLFLGRLTREQTEQLVAIWESLSGAADRDAG